MSDPEAGFQWQLAKFTTNYWGAQDSPRGGIETGYVFENGLYWKLKFRIPFKSSHEGLGAKLKKNIKVIEDSNAIPIRYQTFKIDKNARQLILILGVTVPPGRYPTEILGLVVYVLTHGQGAFGGDRVTGGVSIYSI